jgi:hypothetical protein
VHGDGTKLRGCVWRTAGLVFESPRADQLYILRCTQLSKGAVLEWKFKAIPVQVWTGPDGCSKLRLQELLDIRHMKVASLSALRTGRIYSWEDWLLLVSISVRRWVDPWAKVRCAINIPKSLDGTHGLRLPLIAMIRHCLVCTIVQYMTKQWFVAWRVVFQFTLICVISAVSFKFARRAGWSGQNSPQPVTQSLPASLEVCGWSPRPVIPPTHCSPARRHSHSLNILTSLLSAKFCQQSVSKTDFMVLCVLIGHTLSQKYHHVLNCINFKDTELVIVFELCVSKSESYRFGPKRERHLSTATEGD